MDYVFGIGLYMAPSDMKLRITKTKGYNNKIMKADKNLKLGLNLNVNKVEKNKHTDFSQIELNKHTDFSQIENIPEKKR